MNEPIRNLSELLESAGAASLNDLGQTLASIMGLDETVRLQQASDGAVAATVGTDSYDVEFPTTWDELIDLLSDSHDGNDQGDDNDSSHTTLFID